MYASPSREHEEAGSRPAIPARPLFLAAAIVAVMSSRLLPHPPNFTPVGACALFGGACFADRRAAFALPLGAMAMSDLFLGFSIISAVVYACLALQVAIGLAVRARRSPLTVAGATLLGAGLFFAITNGTCFLAYYPRTWAGLIECYSSALPFFRDSLLGDFTFTALLFGTLAVAEGRFPALRERAAPTPA